MKKICLLICALLCIGVILCSCSESDISQKASEAISELEKSVTGNDDKTVPDNTRETIAYTEAPEETAFENMLETKWDDMVENGEIDDGDGNVGERENDDGDGIADNGAVD